MKLSVVIVNYNVLHFLEQCLYSVFKSTKNIETEVFVVDNNSVDGSCAMVREKFPQVQLIENKDNVGFSRANNQAICIATGEYVLLLNPDTLVQEDTFQKIVEFSDTHSDMGGLGVKMIDGNGNFLPESKRALPTPEVAFYKIFGLARLFPKSKRFGKYHLTYLDKNKIHQVEVLSGAFMLLRKSVLDKIGLLDETFFMYGEDIDLSYRIILEGYKNYYYPETTIIHYKGESTKKGSINYVLVFYNAMLIFARKHFASQKIRLFLIIINLAIWFRASLAILKRIFSATLFPVIDATIIFLGFYVITPLWENYRFGTGTYPKEFMYYIVPSYILLWLFGIYFIGGYRKPIKINRLLKGIALGTLLILLGYSLLSEVHRFSRAMIVFGSMWTFASLIGFRFLMNLTKIKSFKLDFGKRKRIVVVGENKEIERVVSILKQTLLHFDLVGFVSRVVNNHKNKFYLGHIEQLHEIVNIHSIDEIIFCSKSLSAQQIIQVMLQLSDLEVEFKIAPPESLSIIGSNSINTAGELYVININSIAKDHNRRRKRAFDLIISSLFLLFCPFLLLIVQRKVGFFANCMDILMGQKTWVGYSQSGDLKQLPKLLKGVFSTADKLSSVEKQNTKDEHAHEKILLKQNILYAQNYQLQTDFVIVLRNLKKLGQNL